MFFVLQRLMGFERRSAERVVRLDESLDWSISANFASRFSSGLSWKRTRLFALSSVSVSDRRSFPDALIEELVRVRANILGAVLDSCMLEDALFSDKQELKEGDPILMDRTRSHIDDSSTTSLSIDQISAFTCSVIPRLLWYLLVIP